MAARGVCAGAADARGALSCVRLYSQCFVMFDTQVESVGVLTHMSAMHNATFILPQCCQDFMYRTHL